MTRPDENPDRPEQRHYDEKAERHLDANGFSDRQWLWLKIGAAAVLLIVGIAWGMAHG